MDNKIIVTGIHPSTVFFFYGFFRTRRNSSSMKKKIQKMSSCNKNLAVLMFDSPHEIRLTEETRIKLYCQPPVSSLTTFPLLGFYNLVTARH